MGVLLVCLAIAMIVGGGAAIYSGSLIISIERGWSMMIAGSVCASSGAIVLGLAVLAGRLRRISYQTEVLGETMSRIEMATWGPPPPLPPDEMKASHLSAIEPAPAMQPAYVPDLDTHRASPDPDPELVPQIPPVVEMRPSVSSAPASATEPAPVQTSRPVEPTVVGSYSAGENAYLMYSDGSIQADTPEGRFRFDSLDELKAYVAQGERKAQASRMTEPAQVADPQPQTSPEAAEIAKA